MASGPGSRPTFRRPSSSDAERDRDEVDQERRPQAERDRHRHLLDHQVDHLLVAEEALAEVEHQVVLHHQQEAFADRLVEAVHLLDALDQLLRQPARAAIGAAAARGVGRGAAHRLAAGRAAREALGGVDRRALDLRDHLLDRSAGRRLDHEEVDHHDAEQGRYHQQQASQDVGGHLT